MDDKLVPYEEPEEVVDAEVVHEKVQFIRELGGYWRNACLVKQGEAYYVVSSVVDPFGGPETLVFRADETGEPESSLEVAGGRGRSRAEAIKELEDSGPWDREEEQDDGAV